MKNIITSFAFFSLLGFYSNSMATMIMISNETDYSVIPMDVISKFINENINSTVKQERKAGKKVAKTQNKIDKLNPDSLSFAELSSKNQRKVTKLENRIVALLAGLQFDDNSTPAGSTPGGSTPTGSTQGGSTPAGSTQGGSTPAGSTPAGSIASAPAPIAGDLFDGDSQSESVPEPSTIALLGLGLIGLGVARRFKRTS